MDHQTTAEQSQDGEDEQGRLTCPGESDSHTQRSQVTSVRAEHDPDWLLGPTWTV